jgi:L-aminopeptidase/D-esterase-like protein
MHFVPEEGFLIDGVSIGHWSDAAAATGCTAVLVPQGATASADVRGGAPATRETDLLRPGNLVTQVHAICLSGGSAYGLDAATGVMKWLEERGHGYAVRSGVVPIVPAASLFDLSIGDPGVRPGADAGYVACEAAQAVDITEGSVGAGTGATVAKALGPECAIKGGLGIASESTAAGVTVMAIVVVNAFGEIVDSSDGRTVAGPRAEGGGFADTVEVLRSGPLLSPFSGENSTLGVVVTDAVLTKEECLRLATMSQAGLARTIRPVYSPVDGDVIFALATGVNTERTDLVQLGALAARAVERAVLRGVSEATGLAGVPSAEEWLGG